MSDSEPTVAELKEKLKQLEAEKTNLAARLGAGDSSARPDLNRAIQVSNRIEQIVNRLEPRDPGPPVLYGPPASLSRLTRLTGLTDILRTILRRK